jgi:hypothetical protein
VLVTNATWSWRLENAAGEPVAPAALREAAAHEVSDPLEQTTFSTQSDAETWVGEEWQYLLAAGVVGVTLYDGDREVYGPMSLLPAD